MLIIGCNNCKLFDGPTSQVELTEQERRYCIPQLGFYYNVQVSIATLNIVFSVTTSNCLAQLLILNHMCNFTNTKCRPYIICHSCFLLNGHYRFTMLQLLSLTKWIFLQFSIVRDNITLCEC